VTRGERVVWLAGAALILGAFGLVAGLVVSAVLTAIARPW
jgi:hypothetical protein